MWCPPRPLALDYIFSAWRRIRDRTSSGFSGPAPIDYPTVRAFCEVTGTQLSPEDIRILEEIDNTYLDVHYSKDSLSSDAIRSHLTNATNNFRGVSNK